ncbi:MAG: nucleotidyl transferase AbiEii/AbiGii toxin family protein [Candidatus Paceibacterota bacterium]
MPAIHKEILTENQIKLLPVLKLFSRNFGLVGGTAIALQIGHRRSIDFDMFSPKKFNNTRIKNKILENTAIDEIIVSRLDELTFISQGVKFTFFRFIYEIQYAERMDGKIKIPDLLTLAAMKAFALGQRAKWKDYVDLYFIIRDFHGINEIVKKGEELFGGEFNDKIFKMQLGYFNDVRYDEPVEFLPGFEVGDKEIKKKLVEFSLE